MRNIERLGKILAVVGAFCLSGVLAHQFGPGGLWHGFSAPTAAAKPGDKKADYDLTRLEAVNTTLSYIHERYVDPKRVNPRNMLVAALDHIQRDVAQVIVLPAGKGAVKIQVDTHEKEIRVDDVLGPWDVAAKLRGVFAFLQEHLKDTDVDLRSIEYAACNGILGTLDPHSTFLTPEQHKEMNLSTSGHFGGLGIVISIRDQMLTVIRPMPDTPAGDAGIKRYDRVMKINNESTLNMPLDDAVRRLRGKANTKVTVWIEREGEWEGLRKFVLTRRRIQVKSVLSKRLDGGVGYVRLKQFQATSVDEIRQALAEMKDQGELKGLVLDLRGNPGGLLDQAARVADLFVNRGTLVATVGASDGRDEKVASTKTTEPPYPLVVLVNGSSASASEIVAGALKNHGRGVIVGQTTFGKGSVQLIFPDVTHDKAALKLTIAQYLTPGDKSIQGVGVTPHVELDPMTIDPKEMDLTIQREGVRERDLSQHLSNERATKPTKPQQVVRYYFSKKERDMRRERGGELEDEFAIDFPIEFASKLVTRMPANVPAAKQLAAVAGYVEEARKEELSDVSKALGEMKVNWEAPATTPTTGPGPNDFEVVLETDPPLDQGVKAGAKITLKVSITNNSQETVYRLRAKTDSDNPYFNDKELIFGKLAPGETAEATSPLSWCAFEDRRPGSTKPRAKDAKRVCKIPMDALGRSDGVKLRFDALGGFTPKVAEFRPTIQALDRPVFQYSYQVSDDVSGNGDGILQRGEKATVYFTVKNVGVGKSHETQANLANRSGDGVLLRGGRFNLPEMMPGDVRRVQFTFDVQSQLKEDEAVFSLSVGDRDLREYATEKLRIKIEPAVAIEKRDESMTTTAETGLFATATGSGRFGTVRKDRALKVIGSAGAMMKVLVAGKRFAFVKASDLVKGGTPKPAIPYIVVYNHAPPELKVTTSAMAVRSDKVKVHVEASDGEALLDMYLFVGSRKLYYQSNRKGADKRKASFDFEAPLEPGVNLITVVARENPDTTTRRVVVVRRDGPNGELLKTPKHRQGLAQSWLLDAIE